MEGKEERMERRTDGRKERTERMEGREGSKGRREYERSMEGKICKRQRTDGWTDGRKESHVKEKEEKDGWNTKEGRKERHVTEGRKERREEVREEGKTCNKRKEGKKWRHVTEGRKERKEGRKEGRTAGWIKGRKVIPTGRYVSPFWR